MRRLKVPRIYCMRISTDQKVIDKMLGVAFTDVQRQRLYNHYRNAEYWFSREHVRGKIKFYSEALKSSQDTKDSGTA